MRAVLRGLSMVVRDRELRPYIWRPLVHAVPVLLGLLVLSFFILQPVAGLLLGLIQGASWLAGWVAGALAISLWWVLLGPVFFTVAIFLSAFSWEKLSLMVEQKAFPGRVVPAQSHGMVGGMAENLRRLPRTVAVSVGCGLLSPIFYGVLSAMLAGWQSQYDFTAPAFARRGVLWPKQKKAAAGLEGKWGLIAAATFFSWIPFLNLVMLPGFVAAGTLLVADSSE